MTKKFPIFIWLISGIFVTMQYLVCMNVYLMGGDDYMYGTFGHNGVIKPVFSYYFTGNGRWLINIIDSIQLTFDRNLYVVLTPWLILLFAFVIYKFACTLVNRDNTYIFAVSLGLISVIDIQMTRETFYWITGAMNYLVPAILLTAEMMSVLKLCKSDLTAKEMTIYSLICVLSCLTVEQYGLMAIGWMILIWGYEAIWNKKIKKIYLIVFVISLLALSTIIFAPGNYVRINDAAEKDISLFTKIIDLIYYDYYSRTSSIFIFMISVLCSLRLHKSKKMLLSTLSAFNAFIILIFFVYSCLSGSFIVVVISIILSLITIVPVLISMFDRIGQIKLLSFAIIAVGSQVMLLVSQLWGFRTSMSLILIYIVIILVLLCDEIKCDSSILPENIYIYICVICVVINPYLGILSIIVSCSYYFHTFNKHYMEVVTKVILLCSIFVGLGDEVIGYRENTYIHKENILEAKRARNNEISKAIILSYNDEPYGWVSPPFSEWAEMYFRNYYNIPNDIEIEYAEDQNQK